MKNCVCIREAGKLHFELELKVSPTPKQGDGFLSLVPRIRPKPARGEVST